MKKSAPSYGTTFGMVPWSVAVDQRLNPTAVRVFILLAASRRGPDVTIGTRRIAKLLGIGRETVRRAFGALAKCEYLAIEPVAKRGQRAKYTLLSDLFSLPNLKSGPEASFVFAPPEVVCPRCHEARRGLLKIGWCRSCNWKFKVVEIVQEEIERAAS